MKTIVITSQKGGSGKTMLTAHLSIEAERAGDGPVWLLDADRQATLTRWHERRTIETPQLGLIPLAQLAAGLEALAKQHGAKLCLIDTAPTISAQTSAIIDLADLILIPVRPSPSDLWSVAETVELVKTTQKQFLFILTQVKTRANITAQAAAALSQHGRVAQAFISDRVAYAAAMTGGNSAPEIGRGPAGMEIAALWDEVKSAFHEILKTGKKVANG